MGFGMGLKEELFYKTLTELNSFWDMKAKGKPPDVCEAQRQRFCSLMEFVEDAGLRKEYDKWKEKYFSKQNNTGQMKAIISARMR